jgi:hypothetical protein
MNGEREQPRQGMSLERYTASPPQAAAVAPWQPPGTGALILAALDDWLPASGPLTAGQWQAHRARQVELVLWHLVVRARDGRLWQQGMDDTVQVAVNMLRAGPDASLLQQLQGRYV